MKGCNLWIFVLVICLGSAGYCAGCGPNFGPDCVYCNFEEGYGNMPTCDLCMSPDSSATSWCSPKGTKDSWIGEEDPFSCVCVCRNYYYGDQCNLCPENFDDVETQCGKCKNDFLPFVAAGGSTICSPRCTSANCSGAGTPGSDDSWATGCTCQCSIHRVPSTKCATCEPGWDITQNCEVCLPGYEKIANVANDALSTCARQCTPEVDCVAANTGSALGNVVTGCKCMCLNKWHGDRCEQCAPNMDSECNACAVGYDGPAPNCSRKCVAADCFDRIVGPNGVSGNLRDGCNCTCRNYWRGDVVSGLIYRNCTECPPHFDTSSDCSVCVSGYTVVNRQCEELCTIEGDCHGRASVAGGTKGNCTCYCRNQWEQPFCATCPARFSGSDCDECNVGYKDYPTCIKNCTNEVDCSYHASSVEGHTNGTCTCTCRNAWNGLQCETCPDRYNRDTDCTGCNATTHEGENLQCYRKCTVQRNCSSHADSVVGNDNTACQCQCQNKWNGYTCDECDPRYDRKANCGACSASYEKYPDCYLKCTNEANCNGRATTVSGNIVDGCVCECDSSTQWHGDSCQLCPANFNQGNCSACAEGFTKYPHCYALCTNANCSQNAISWSGDSSIGCQCVCKDKWLEPFCEVCPPGAVLEGGCKTCREGYGGPKCQRICTIADDCSSNAVTVSGYEGECQCNCTTNWGGDDCGFCPPQFVAANDCDGCSLGYVRPPMCYLNCTIASNCSSHATSVTGDSGSGCECSCRNQWSGLDCSVCTDNYNEGDDCGSCAPTYDLYPKCVRDCTDTLDCSGHSTEVTGSYPNCTCTCRNQWTGRDCGYCPPSYDASRDCSGCAVGYRGAYPDCYFICTAAANCSSHATDVAGDQSTGCECSCAYMWDGDACEVCPPRYSPETNCSTCAKYHTDYPTCTYHCNDELDCSGHSESVTGIEWNCTCSCRNHWASSNCSVCPQKYNASNDCNGCAAGYEQYPECFHTCTSASNCSGNAVSVAGNSASGCNCTCRHRWYGEQCELCPALYDRAADCNACLPGWSGFPNCRELCTNATDCSGRATSVEGYKGECNCACRNGYSGDKCQQCTANFNAALDCGECAVGYDTYPTCALTCTVDGDCSSKATNVTGNHATGCKCECRNKWSGLNCGVCPVNYEPLADCGACAEGHVGYPYCDRVCTNWEDCNGNARSVTGLYPNCSCSCDAQWNGDDCSQCPQQYDSLNNCASCAVGFTGTYPSCSFVCTIASNCSNHATSVSGTTLTGCTCACRSQWGGDDCSRCEDRYNPLKDCGACNYGFEDYPTCRTACMVDRDCGKRASNVTGVYPDCVCGCRNKWEGDRCESCPSKYNATADCSACNVDREWYPECYRLCTFDDCSSNAVEVSGNEFTGCSCKCRNAYEGDNCDICPPTVDETRDCAHCKEGFDGYPTCGPQCTPDDCTNRSVAVSGGRPNCSCVCRHGWSGPDCSVCPEGYIESTDCYECSDGYTRVGGKCYRNCNLELDCNGRGLAVTGNLGTGCQCLCRNNYTTPTCSLCPLGYNATADCVGCADGWGGYPKCTPLCTNETDCSGRAVEVAGILGECMCVCRNGWWGYRCEICPAQYNLADDCGTCNKYRRQDYPNCSRLSRSMPTPTFSLQIPTFTAFVPTNTSSNSLPLPSTRTASTLTALLSTSLTSVSTHTLSHTCTSTRTHSLSMTATGTSMLTDSRSPRETKSRPIPPTRTLPITQTPSLPNCDPQYHCVHANVSYRVGYDCACVCYGNWTGARCDQCPERYATHRDSKGVPQGCAACAPNFVARNGTCVTSSHFYGSLDAGNESCAATTVTSKERDTGLADRVAFLEALSEDLRLMLISIYTFFECPNADRMWDDGVFTATVFDMYTTSPTVPARDVRYLFDAVLWNETKSVAVRMSDCLSGAMVWLLDVFKNGNVFPTTAEVITTESAITTAAPTRTPRPTFAPNGRSHDFLPQDAPTIVLLEANNNTTVTTEAKTTAQPQPHTTSSTEDPTSAAASTNAPPAQPVTHYPILMMDNATMFTTRIGSDWLSTRMGANGSGCLALTGGSFGSGDYARCGIIGCAPADFDPAPAPEEDGFPWWWIVLSLIILIALILAIYLVRKLQLRRRIEEVVNPKDTHKYTLQFLLSEDEELRQIAQDREQDEVDFFDDDDLL